MTFLHPPHDVPDVILLLGIDASGKDHVANTLARFIRELGGDVEKRKRFFSGRVTKEAYSVNKGFLDRLQERLFLASYPYSGAVLPFLMHALIRFDLALFRPSDKKLIVVGHNALRALAFHWGHSEQSTNNFHIPAYLRKTLHMIKDKTGAHVIVLDVDHEVREARIARRMRHKVADLFDRYMTRCPERSERIEACLARAARELLNGVVLMNNDLHDDDLRAHIWEGFRSRPKPLWPQKSAPYSVNNR